MESRDAKLSGDSIRLGLIPSSCLCTSGWTTNMSTYQFELPTTGSISFGDFCLDSSRGAHARDISSTTQHRANLRGVLKETKRTDGEKDFLRIIKVLAFKHTVNSTTHARD